MIIPVIIVYLVGMIIMKILFHKYGKLEFAFKENVKKRNQEMENSINGFADVRSYNTQKRHKEMIRFYNDSIYQNRIKKTKLTILTNGSIDVIDLLALIIVVIYSVKSIQSGILTQAAAMSIVMYVMRIMDPLGNILNITEDLSSYLGMASDYDMIINHQNKISDGPLVLDEFNNDIKFENVSFAYESTSDVLDDVSLTIKKGEKIGICGISGGGKSTMLKLLNHFYLPNKGKILIDGININDISDESYRKFFGSVHQENVIFPGTIRENIVYGNINASENELISACKKANIHDFIMDLDDKFNTIVGPRGLTLSGGQR